MKIFISSPMRGKTYEQLIAERKAIINNIEPLNQPAYNIANGIANVPLPITVFAKLIVL